MTKEFKMSIVVVAILLGLVCAVGALVVIAVAWAVSSDKSSKKE